MSSIGSVPVRAKARKLRAKWTQEAADDLRALWSIGRLRRPSNALDLLNDALEDPDYDPDSPEPYRGRWRWPDGRIATPEEIEQEAHPERALVEAMAAEMRDEIDREILYGLKKSAQADPFEPPVAAPKRVLPRDISDAIELTSAPAAVKAAFREALTENLP
jgi:hypothetical protein